MTAARKGPPCTVGTALAEARAQVAEWLASSMTAREVADMTSAVCVVNVGRQAVERHRRGDCACVVDETAPARDNTPPGWEASAERAGDTGSITTGPRTEPVTDWSALLREWGFDPECFEVDDDAITFRTWDGFAKVDGEDGKQRAVSKRLFSYRATIRRRNPNAIPVEAFAEWRRELIKLRPRRPALPPRGGTYALHIADPQIGKERTEEAVANWKRGVVRHLEQAADMDAARILVGFLGDETEGCANNYGNQPHTIELNRSEQMLLDFDLRMWTIRAARSVAPVLAASVRSNHGEWTRNGGKDVVTTRADNASTFVAELCKRTCVEAGIDGIEWVIANDGPHAVVELDGVKVYMSHFYEQKGRGGGSSKVDKTRGAIERQIIGRTAELGDVGIYVTAHFHHYYTQTWEGRTQMGCPALEAERSSGYMLNEWGVWSRPGMLGFRVGEQFGPDGWADVNIF